MIHGSDALSVALIFWIISVLKYSDEAELPVASYRRVDFGNWRWHDCMDLYIPAGGDGQVKRWMQIIL